MPQQGAAPTLGSMGTDADRARQPDWTSIDPHLYEGSPLLAVAALKEQGIPVREAIDLVNDRAAALYDANPASFSTPPPWPDTYT